MADEGVRVVGALTDTAREQLPQLVAAEVRAPLGYWFPADCATRVSPAPLSCSAGPASGAATARGRWGWNVLRVTFAAPEAERQITVTGSYADSVPLDNIWQVSAGGAIAVAESGPVLGIRGLLVITPLQFLRKHFRAKRAQLSVANLNRQNKMNIFSDKDQNQVLLNFQGNAQAVTPTH